MFALRQGFAQLSGKLGYAAFADYCGVVWQPRLTEGTVPDVVSDEHGLGTRLRGWTYFANVANVSR